MKRLFDVCFAGISLVLLSPLLLVVGLLVRMKLGSPVLFTQTRPGLHGKPFRLNKFRTMINLGDGASNQTSDAERLIPFGQFLRSTSIDELPELWSVLKGDMSMVGPRPLFMEYLPLYSQEAARRHEVRPGITGWAQVNGRNAISWEEKFGFDVWYVDHRSMWLDLKILLRTLVSVLSREGISAEGDATMPRFTGSRT